MVAGVGAKPSQGAQQGQGDKGGYQKGFQDGQKAAQGGGDKKAGGAGDGGGGGGGGGCKSCQKPPEMKMNQAKPPQGGPPGGCPGGMCG